MSDKAAAARALGVRESQIADINETEPGMFSVLVDYGIAGTKKYRLELKNEPAGDPGADASEMSRAELQAALKALGLKASGKTADMRARLEAARG